MATRKALILEIRNRMLTFWGDIMKKDGLENLILRGRLKEGRERPRKMSVWMDIKETKRDAKESNIASNYKQDVVESHEHIRHTNDEDNNEYRYTQDEINAFIGVMT